MVRHRRSERIVKLTLRLAALTGLGVLAAALVDLQSVWQQISSVSVVTFGLMVTLHSLIIVLISWRFAIIAWAAGARNTLLEANRLTFASTLANLLLPTSLAGDAGRVWLIRNHGLSSGKAVAVGIFDRVVGLASLGVIVLIGATFSPVALPHFSAIGISGLIATVACVGLVRWRYTVRANKWSTDGPMLRPGVIGSSVVLSSLGHLLAVGSAFLFLHDQEATVSFALLMVLFPAVLLAASVPISIGGWGTRELAAVAVFPISGLAAPSAVAVTLTFGLAQLTAAMLGFAVFWLLRRNSAPR